MANAAETVKLAGTRRTQIPLAAVGAAAERVVGGAARRWKLSLVGAAAVGALALASGAVAALGLGAAGAAGGVRTAVRNLREEESVAPVSQTDVKPRYSR